MEDLGSEAGLPNKIGDRSTSDVVVRLRPDDGRDEWLYCHSDTITAKSKYFAERLSDSWPTCKIIDSRSCVEVFCLDTMFDYYVSVLRLLYVIADDYLDDLMLCVRNALGILQVAVELGCPLIVTACVNYLEAVPWDENEEEEILKIIPGLGSQVEPIIARLQPVDTSAITVIFLSAIQFATSSPPLHLNDLKSSAQEQLEYMLTEDDDSPLVKPNGKIKFEVNECIKGLFSRLRDLVGELLCGLPESVSEAKKNQLFQSYLSDLSWAFLILTKLETTKDFIFNWMDVSENIVQVVDRANPTFELIATRLKVIEVAAKVLEAIGCGSVILPTPKRLQMVKIWLPFARITKPAVDSVAGNGDDGLTLTTESELWSSLESAFVSMILALPSGEQADILVEWLQNEQIRYPDLTEAFEVWSYRTKVAKRRLTLVKENLGTANIL